MYFFKSVWYDGIWVISVRAHRWEAAVVASWKAAKREAQMSASSEQFEGRVFGELSRAIFGWHHWCSLKNPDDVTRSPKLENRIDLDLYLNWKGYLSLQGCDSRRFWRCWCVPQATWAVLSSVTLGPMPIILNVSYIRSWYKRRDFCWVNFSLICMHSCAVYSPVCYVFHSSV